MNQTLSNVRKRHTHFMPAMLSALIVAGALAFSPVQAGNHGGKKGHDKGEERYEKMERLANKLDMTDEQEVKLKKILSDAKSDAASTRGNRKGMRQEMMRLNPDDPAYMTKVIAQADEMATQMKAKMIAHAKVRQQIYGILTDEQKQTMQQMKESRMNKMKKKQDK